MALVALLGTILGFIGVIWICIIAFQNGDPIWGVVGFFCGIAAIIYGVQHFDEAKIPLGLMVLGIVLSVVGRLAMRDTMVIQ